MSKQEQVPPGKSRQTTRPADASALPQDAQQIEQTEQTRRQVADMFDQVLDQHVQDETIRIQTTGQLPSLRERSSIIIELLREQNEDGQ